MHETNFDIIIVGNGLVGSTVAIGLIKQGFSIAIIDSNKISKCNNEKYPDIRVSAINISSINFLKKLGVWNYLNKIKIHPYNKLKTWECKNSYVSFSSKLLGLSKLGYMIENDVLKYACWMKLKEKKPIFYNTKLINIIRYNNIWKATLLNNQQITSKMIIGADGFNSIVRNLSGINIKSWKYNHSCMLITIKCKFPSGNVTWQKFNKFGICAFLPLYNNWASLVLYDTSKKLKKINSLSKSELLKEIKKRFFYKQLLKNDFDIVNKKIILLHRLHAESYIKEGLVLIGDAAHTINPIAGQGLNLGYKDAKILINILKKYREKHELWYTKKVLQTYHDNRYFDNLIMQNSIDLFYLIFKQKSYILKFFRNFSMYTLQQSDFLKKKILIYALGLN